MIGVDQIGRIRRAYFEQRWPIKEIVRTLALCHRRLFTPISAHMTRPSVKV
jgi:hypothetical protein